VYAHQYIRFHTELIRKVAGYGLDHPRVAS